MTFGKAGERPAKRGQRSTEARKFRPWGLLIGVSIFRPLGKPPEDSRTTGQPAVGFFAHHFATFKELSEDHNIHEERWAAYECREVLHFLYFCCKNIFARI